VGSEVVKEKEREGKKRTLLEREREKNLVL
jgi:hypothetical protein